MNFDQAAADNPEEQLSASGELLLSSDCRLDILAFLVESLQFSDSTSAQRATKLLHIILKHRALQWASSEGGVLGDMFIGVLIYNKHV